jgi:hypothetical protein
MKIRITTGKAWYANKVGEVYDVTEEADSFYIVSHIGSDYKFTVGKENCEIVDESLTPNNMVESPPHYQNARFETIEVIEEITAGYSDGFVAYSVGNALKYLARAPFKHNDGGLEDLRKAAKYLEFAIKRIEAKEDGE